MAARWRRAIDELTGRSRRRELAALLARFQSALERQGQASVQAFTRIADIGGQNAIELGRLHRLAEDWRNFPTRNDRIDEHLRNMLDKAGISGGRVLEVGGRNHLRGHVFPPDRFHYDNLDIVPELATLPGDITACPQIADGLFDVIVSIDVFEHVKQPWLAAGEITRLLAPGGLTYTSTLFSWRYHPCPVDFWRFTPDALDFLFADLTRLDSGFDLTERRRDFRKKSVADPAPVDALGGWRENVRVFHAAVKPAAA